MGVGTVGLSSDSYFTSATKQLCDPLGISPWPHLPGGCSQKNENHRLPLAEFPKRPTNPTVQRKGAKRNYPWVRDLLMFWVCFRPWTSAIISMFFFVFFVVVVVVVVVFGNGEAGAWRKWANNQIFNTMLAFAFLCILSGPWHSFKEKKFFLLEHLCKIR